MKKLLLISVLMFGTSMSAFAVEGITEKLNEKGVLCNYEEFLVDTAYKKALKDPQNQELKLELNKVQKLSVYCWSKADQAADSATNCEEAIDNIADVGSLCTAEEQSGNVAYYLAKTNPTQSNKDFLSATQKASVHCMKSSYDICKP